MPGRMDASQEQTDVEFFAPLEPRADGFRNYISSKKLQFMQPEEALVDRAQLLTADGAGDDGSPRRPARSRRECRRLQARRLHQAAREADERLLRQPARHEHGVARPSATTPTKAATARPRRSSGPATAVDLIFGSHSQLRAFAEVYALRGLEGEVREGLRGGVDQGDERRPLRPRLSSAETADAGLKRSVAKSARPHRYRCGLFAFAGLRANVGRCRRSRWFDGALRVTCGNDGPDPPGHRRLGGRLSGVRYEPGPQASGRSVSMALGGRLAAFCHLHEIADEFVSSREPHSRKAFLRQTSRPLAGQPIRRDHANVTEGGADDWRK